MTLELSRSAVFLDFDGTITTRDTGIYVLERLAGDSWRKWEQLYEQRAIGSRECMFRQWACLPTKDESLLRSVAREVTLDPDFFSLIGELREAGAEVAVLSDGFGYYAQEICQSVGINVITNEVDWSTGELSFRDPPKHCACAECGTCKRTPLNDARDRGLTTILIGDGTSDRLAAPLADTLFAKNELADWCRASGVPFQRFRTLADVRSILRHLATTPD